MNEVKKKRRSFTPLSIRLKEAIEAVKEENEDPERYS